MAATVLFLLLIFGKFSATTEFKSTEVEKSHAWFERQVEKLISKYELLEETTRELAQKNARLERLEREMERLKTDNQLCKTYLSAEQNLRKQLHDPETPSVPALNEKKNRLKRSDDLGNVEPVLSQVTQRVNEMGAEIQALKQTSTRLENTIGTTYIRWGHNACPNSSEIVYSGHAGGGDTWGQTGAATNHLCLPYDPVFDNHPVPRYSAANLLGAEYNTCDEPECDTTPVCAVCRIPRASSIVIAGTNKCSAGWTVEYSGYIMAGIGNRPGASEFICVDSSRLYLPGSQVDQGGNTIYYTIFKCGSLPCPPYVDGKIVLCVVCSK